MRMYLEPDGEARSLFWTLHGSVTRHGTARHGKKSEREEQARRENLYVQYYCIRGGAEPASCRLHCGSGDGDGVWGIVRELVR